MSSKNISCEEMKFKVMALLDNELPDSEINFVREHLEGCPVCSEKYLSLKKVKEITDTMKFKELPEMYWDEYWTHVYNKMERGISWIFISIGAIIVLSFIMWTAVSNLITDTHISPMLKTGIFVLSTGIVILIVSVVREKIMVKRIDKYREVER